ncbi:MAG: hypothetical protein M1817_000760 [Caeruleum heppii]|nr:MAG: hypothetical protein M1817_000760 [Caeruleum heppii]
MATSTEHRSAPLDLSYHFSRVTNNRRESAIKDFYKYFSIPNIGNLAGGLPNASYFPYDSLEAAVALPKRFTPTPNESDTADFASSDSASSRILVPRVSASPNPIQKIDVTSALQYGTAQGYPPLHSFLRQFTRENLHPNIPYAGGPEIILTCGNTDGFAKALELLSNDWSEQRDWIRDRDGILVEEFAYMNAIQAAAPRGLQIVPVKMDGEGMKGSGDGGLRDVLANWDANKGKRPHLMYTVTVGQNPTSGTLSVERRKELYSICKEYDIIIIEDDPYWYLQYPSAVEAEKNRGEGLSAAALEPSKGQKSSGFEFLDSLVPSYLSLDTDGRVVRLDTFSKTVAPGCRLGWITAQPAFVERILRITEVSTQQPSGFVQSMVAELLLGPQARDGGRGGGKDGQGWAVDGWVRWLAGLRGAYERRMQTMCTILEEGKYKVRADSRKTSASGRLEESGSGWSMVEKVKMYDFVWPRGGMFVWVHLNLATHPLFGQLPVADLSHALWVFLTTKPYLVLVAPGLIFSPTPALRAEKGPHYMRLCFAAVEEEEVGGSSHRFVEAFNHFWAKRDVEELRGLLQEAAQVGCSQM